MGSADRHDGDRKRRGLRLDYAARPHDPPRDGNGVVQRTIVGGRVARFAPDRTVLSVQRRLLQRRVARCILSNPSSASSAASSSAASRAASSSAASSAPILEAGAGGSDAGERDVTLGAEMPPILDGSSETGVESDGAAGADALASARALCVAIINQDRATLNPPSPPLAEDTGEESCVDRQAAADEASNTAHSAFGQCSERAQDECPDWGGSLTSIVTKCLAQMWGRGTSCGRTGQPFAQYVQCSVHESGLWLLPNLERIVVGNPRFLAVGERR